MLAGEGTGASASSDRLSHLLVDAPVGSLGNAVTGRRSDVGARSSKASVVTCIPSAVRWRKRLSGPALQYTTLMTDAFLSNSLHTAGTEKTVAGSMKAFLVA